MAGNGEVEREFTHVARFLGKGRVIRGVDGGYIADAEPFDVEGKLGGDKPRVSKFDIADLFPKDADNVEFEIEVKCRLISGEYRPTLEEARRSGMELRREIQEGNRRSVPITRTPRRLVKDKPSEQGRSPYS
jgi:hypothetical protein